MNRSDKLLNELQCKNNQAIVLHSSSNMHYISKFTGEGLVFISNGIKAIITDFRYVEQTEKEAPDFTLIMTNNSKNHNAILAELVETNSIASLYYEDNFLSVKGFEEIKELLGSVEFLSTNNAIQNLRMVKDKEEIDNIRKACKITSEAFIEFLPYIKKDMTEKELVARLEYILKLKGSLKLAFSTICAAGANGSLPHAVPSDYKLQHGDMVTFDFGANWNNYCADMTRTIALKTPSDIMLNIYNIVENAQKLGKKALKAGAACKEVDAVSRDYIKSQGYDKQFGHGLGHSLGIDIHESPYLNQRSNDFIKINEVLTVEPGIYIPGVGGVRIEDTCLVTETGSEELTLVERELIIL